MEHKLTGFLIAVMSLFPLMLLSPCSKVLVKLIIVNLVKNSAFRETERLLERWYLNFTHSVSKKLKFSLSTCRAAMCVGGGGENC
jgi:hypothetical protein